LSTFVSNHDFVNGCPGWTWWISANRAHRRRALIPPSARNLHNNPASSEHNGQKRCEPAVHRRGMAKIIPVQFKRSRLPRRLLNDGWWLESKPALPSVVGFPKPVTPKPGPDSKAKVPHLTLVTSEK
jgi:hypothetical protein